MQLPKLVPPGVSYVKIPCSKRAAMRLLLEVVQRGSRYWTSGTIPIGKALSFAAKMQSNYSADATQAQRAYAKSRGRANTTLIIYPDSADVLRFWLLATPGTGAIHEREQLQDAHNKRSRLSWGERYELEHLQRPRAHGGSRAWTWRLWQESYVNLEAAMRQHASRPGSQPERRDDLRSLVDGIMRMPGFHGIRQQQIALLRLGRDIWSRTHAAGDGYLWPDKVAYLDKGFNCYHRPDPLRLDVLVRVAEQRAKCQPDPHAFHLGFDS